jgi:ferritin
MLSKTIQTALNTQIGLELFAQSAYLQASGVAYSLGLYYTNKWLTGESKSECKHAHLVAEYVKRRGGAIAIPSVDAAPAPADLQSVAQTLLALEERVTESLTQLQLLAEAEKDRQTYAFLQGMIAEQTQGEDAARTFARMVLSGADLLTIDQAVGAAFGSE